MAKKAKKSTHTAVKTAKKRFRLTFFQIKIIVGAMVVLLSYRYPLQAVQNQEILTLVVVSFLLLSKPSPFYRLLKKFSYPKFMFVLIYLTFIVPVMGYANTKYLDWDNAQMIKGLVHDFPELVEQIEQATGLDLEVSSNCMTTTEKFSSGVRTCEIVMKSELNEANSQNKEVAEKIIKANNTLRIVDKYQYSNGYELSYRNKNSCDFTTEASIYLSCLVGVRDSSIETAKEQFNQIK